MENKKNEMEQSVEILDSDFSFLKSDESIHDQKFETKPTTFFKDAMKRFVKNRSSVVAASILAVLIVMSIVVPFADKNDINTPQGDLQYLPPKWFDGNLNGFFDGTDMVTGAILDPETQKLAVDENGKSDYVESAIVGGINVYSSYSDMYSSAVARYGKGGCLTLANQSPKMEGVYEGEDQGILSKEVTLDLSKDYDYSVSIDPEQTVLYADSSLRLHLTFLASVDGEETYIPLTETVDWDSSLTRLACEHVSVSVKSYFEDKSLGVPSSLTGRIGIVVDAPEDEKSGANVLAISSVSSSIKGVGFASGIEARRAIAEKFANAYSSFGKESKPLVSIKHVEVLYGSFRYDYYAAAFGDVTHYSFSPTMIEDYVERGWMEFEWGPAGSSQPAKFVLTPEGETYCPLRSVDYQVVSENPLDPSMTVHQLFGTMSNYRLLYSQGKIGSCEMPKYAFGTDRNGKDFFKVVFSGLLTSLGLGLLASAINIVIGLIWGSISGYFGGWVDLIMERLTEILGGVPFIIVMTLVALLWNQNGGGTTFWTFLLALCLTGWIGISGTTRSQFYRYKGREYVLASRTLGASDTRLIFKHILPNAIGTIVTSAVLMIPSVIFTEANISYLLPGALALKGSFGVTIESVQGDISRAPYLIVSASLIMALLMICFNLFGNGLRDAFNPSLKGSDE